MNAPAPAEPAAPALDVVVVSFRSRDCLPAALAALARDPAPRHDVVVVDNASDDGTVDVVRRAHPDARVLANERNEGFAAACNRGWRAGSGNLVLFLNPDAVPEPGALAAMAGVLAARPEVGIVGPRTLNADGSVQVSTGSDLSLASEIGQRRLVRGVARRNPRALAAADERHAREHEPDWVSGSCLMARRACLEAIDGFDDGFFLYEEDADLCRRARAAGWRVVFTPRATVVHQLGRSMAQDPLRARLEYHRSHLRYYRKHCSPAAVAVLRCLLLARAAGAWLAALRRGDAAARHDAALLIRASL